MPKARLQCLMNGEPVGSWQLNANHQDQFLYQSSWLQLPGSRPLSLSMPMRGPAYRGGVVTSFFDNLLPDLPAMRTRLAARLGVKSSAPWDILSELGRDCAGAIQLIPEHIPRAPQRVSGVPLRPETLGKFLKIVPRTPILRCLRHHFRVALAGVQEKTALLFYQGQWRMPTHSTPTTHIFKLDNAENEYLCQLILKAYGIPTVNSQLHSVGALAVERFDRRWSSDGTRLLRIPTEDMCQALAVPSQQRYQRDGGPGIKQIMDLLLGSAQANQDRLDFFRTQIVYWLLAALDGHAKNFSIFVEAGGRFRLAPRYDVVSSYPNANQDMAMAVDGQYAWDQITPQHWLNQARACKLKGQVLPMIRQLVEQTPQVIASVRAQLPWDFPAQLADSILQGLSQKTSQLSGLENATRVEQPPPCGYCIHPTGT
ncbi:HipA domain-containing protein [bacterium]|nr:HipA domain-containing protein [bacterium]